MSINTRRREFLREVLEPVVHTAQQIIDSGNGAAADPNSSLSGVCLIFGVVNVLKIRKT